MTRYLSNVVVFSPSISLLYPSGRATENANTGVPMDIVIADASAIAPSEPFTAFFFIVFILLLLEIIFLLKAFICL